VEQRTIEAGVGLRLVPVVAWPVGSVPSDFSTVAGFVDLQAVDNTAAMTKLLLAVFPEISKGAIRTAFPGGFCLLDRDSVLITPQCCADLGDFASWQEICRLPPEVAGWISVYIGHPQLMARAAGEKVWLTMEDDLAESPRPHPDAPVWIAPMAALRHAVLEAERVLEQIAPRIEHALEGLLSDDLRPVAREWILRGTGDYHILKERAT
jgi:hypothetical protein